MIALGGVDRLSRKKASCVKGVVPQPFHFGFR